MAPQPMTEMLMSLMAAKEERICAVFQNFREKLSDIL
jgi:hypothetical protein